MTEQTLALQLQPDSDSSFIALPFAHLEQVFVKELDDYADLADADQMLALAQAGITAWEYVLKNCPYAYKDDDGIWFAEFGFYVWPSSMDLDFEVPEPGTLLLLGAGLLGVRQRKSKQGANTLM